MKTKHILKALLNTVLNFVLAAFIIMAVQSVTSHNVEANNVILPAVLIAIGSLFVQTAAAYMGFKTVKGLSLMALQTEVWVDDIQKVLFQQNPFLNFAKDHSAFISNKTVHIPQAGASPSVTKNRSIYPGTISQRADTDLTYDMMNFTADPTHMTNIDQLQINYNKRQSIMDSYYEKLGNVMGNTILYQWAPSGSTRIVSTTGSASALSLPHSTATGTRKAITLLDISKAKAKLDNDNVPADGRILLMPADMYNNELLAISEIKQFYSYNAEVLKTGIAGYIYGFAVMIRPQVFVYDASNVIKAIDDEGEIITPATDDFNACLAYHPKYVSRALGAINVIFNPDRAEYYGGIFSAEVNMGASKMRSDQKGVVAIVQAA